MSDDRDDSIQRELEQFEFFRGFPDDVLSEVSSFVIEQSFSPGDYLLAQGKANRSLFFLREGNVSVYVDGEVVSRLSTPGEVLGEISLISRTPATASVRADSHVRVFRLSEDSLSGIDQGRKATFQNLLDRVYASVLAQRLTRTNEKAKLFEAANRDLLAAHEQLREINDNLEGEIARRSREMVDKVGSLINTHLRPTQATLSQIVRDRQPGQPAPEAQELIPLAQSIGEVIDFLQPLAELANKTPSGTRVLLCDASKKQQSIARLALGGTGVDLSIATEPSELNDVLSGADFDLILCDSNMKDALPELQSRQSQTPIALLTHTDRAEQIEILKTNPNLRFFVSRDTSNRTFTVKTVVTTVSKILSGDIFGMEKYLSSGTRIQERTVSDSNDRSALIDEMEAYFSSVGVRSGFLDSLRTVSEELLMNAIYDAPADSNGKALYNHLPRTERIKLSPQHEAKLRFGTDGVLMAVSVTDPFGSLKRQVIDKYLESGLKGEEVKSADKGGAGRGLHMIVENSDLTVFNVKEGRKTEVICLMSLERAKDESHIPMFQLFFT